MDFVLLVRNASPEDSIAQMTPQILARLRNPPEHPIEINNPGIRHSSISVYLALEHASQNAYNRVLRSTRQNFPEIPGFGSLLSFYEVENLIATYTGIEPIEQAMCPDSCVGFTGPFQDLENCPVCGQSKWNQSRLEATHGRVKIPAKTFTTIPLGPQLQALYRDPHTAQQMEYLSRRTQEILDEVERTRQISVIDDIAAGWDYCRILSMSL